MKITKQILDKHRDKNEYYFFDSSPVETAVNSLAEGIKHYYSERDKQHTVIIDKLVVYRFNENGELVEVTLHHAHGELVDTPEQKIHQIMAANTIVTTLDFCVFTKIIQDHKKYMDSEHVKHSLHQNIRWCFDHVGRCFSLYGEFTPDELQKKLQKINADELRKELGFVWHKKTEIKEILGRMVQQFIECIKGFDSIEDIDTSLVTEIEIDGVDMKDYPDFCDAYVSAALYKGEPMSEELLENLNENHSSFVYDHVFENASFY